MTVSLTPELERLIAGRVQSGQYDSPAEVIREGLLRLAQEEAAPRLRVQELRREIAAGIAQADAGQTRPFDAEDILRRVRQRIEGQVGEE